MSITYDPRDATRVTHQNLPMELQAKFTEGDIYEILDLNYLADDDVYNTNKICEKRGTEISEAELEIVFKAEEVFLRQIGVM